MLKFYRTLRYGLNDPDSRDVFLSTLAILAAGTVIYSILEGWSLIDSLYFSVVALATVGFGDLAPETTLGRIFTVIYILSGISLIVAFANTYLTLARRMNAGEPV